MDRTDRALEELAAYGLAAGLIRQEDLVYTINQLLMVMGRDDFAGSAEGALALADTFTEEDIKKGRRLEAVLTALTDDACKRGAVQGDSPAGRDLFDTRLMGVLTPRPSAVIDRFRSLYHKDPKEAASWYYTFSQNTDYIRRYRICRDLKWKCPTPYGDLDISINLSKPEKDPRAIAAAKNTPASAYPKCQLCRENEGYAGRMNHPARENHRVIPLTLGGEDWYFQYSPYVYYNEHCIVLASCHRPMKISRETFVRLFDFVKAFPHYFIGSNADLPIVGGSILSHDHFQGGRYHFAMENAPIERHFTVPGFEDLAAGIVRWPMSCIRLAGPDTGRIIQLAERILSSWRDYSDPDAFIYARTQGQMHNTVTPIARKRGSSYELDLVLRNNLTTKDRPLGLFHPRQELHHIKKENIGLIEVMGLAVLPARLKKEMAALKKTVLAGRNPSLDALAAPHAVWFESLKEKYSLINEENIDQILRKEIGMAFLQVLEDAGVYKRNAAGQAAFDRFIRTI